MNPEQTTSPITLTGQQGNGIPTLNPVQEFLLPFVSSLITFWWFVWLVTAMVLIRFVYTHGIRSNYPDDTEEARH